MPLVPPPMRRAATRVKVCCIANPAEARAAVSAGAAAVGFVSAMPSGAGVIPEERIPEISATLPPGVATVLLTCQQDPETILAQQRRCRVNTLQLVDVMTPGALAHLRAALPGIAIIQVVHVTGEKALAQARAAAPLVDAILLDSGNPIAPVKELGGTGRVHDWEISRRIREQVARPVFLAGGLNPSNVADAIRAVRPFAVDVCTGVRTAGRLDEVKLAAFFAAVREA